MPEREFTPLVVDDFLDLGDADETIEWILEDYLPAGAGILLVVRPKEGKTTLAYELAVKVAQGQPFLGRYSRQIGVLIVAVEEHQRDIRLRLHALDAGGLSNLYVAAGQLESTPDTLADIERFTGSARSGWCWWIRSARFGGWKTKTMPRALPKP